MQRQKVEPRTLKGFSDLGRKQTVVRDELFSKIKEIFVRYGFLPIETPTLEYRDILMNKIGEDEKLIYSFTDHGDREVAMRYDLTVPMARYVAQNMGTITFPFKRYQMQPVWRADNTQKGRSREFYQCDVDIVGSDSLTAEVEVINCLLSTLDNIGLNNSVVRISDRRLFNGFASRLSGGADMVVSLIRLVDKVYKKDNDALIEEAREHYAFFEQDCVILENVLEFIRNNKPLSELSDIVEVDQHVEATLEYIIDQVETNGFEGRIRFDLGITRGLDYYSATVWEIFIKDESLAIGCGGRYDKLLESFSDTGKPAVGGSLGISRIMEIALSTQEFVSPIKYLIFNLDDKMRVEYTKLAKTIRHLGHNTDLYIENDKLDKQFKYAEKLAIPYGIIFGPEELDQRVLKIRNLNDRTEKTVPLDEIESHL